jgi:hypothetical protein
MNRDPPLFLPRKIVMPFVILYVSQSLGDLLPLDFLPKKEMGTYELK